ncbi:MAG: molybdate ABC transporter permease subunit [Caldilineae bacterium]|nr:molybdate ABC transporter permease subunit [Anaerolineae bacterium]MCB0201592.1 molybdate ABC transporter permease subunit [Anaerolineae bacterium]MCB0203921.1 molybdate ABC transporter permease subunit [Anaerolineae bacterium]MCB0254018.1 molybdate ABC transporter permease subunit [Anaerolineae bacterium]MCB9155268.1 molybdate ABC transporter permease subunit [Caldilineae bacterium]
MVTTPTSTSPPIAVTTARLERRWRRSRDTVILLVFSAPLLIFLALPLLALIVRAAPVDLLANLFDPDVAQAIWLSMATTTTTLLLTLVLGTPVAFLLARRRFRGRAALDTLIDLPIVLPPLVAGIALLLAFGRRGLLGQQFSVMGIDIAFTRIAVVMAQLFVAAPFFVKAATAGFANVDREIEYAAALDGASSFQVFRLITIPLSGAALLAGAIMTWARALGEFGATIIFAGNFPGRTQTMPLAIYLGFELELNRALTLSAILLLASFLVLFIVKVLLRQRLQVWGQ